MIPRKLHWSVADVYSYESEMRMNTANELDSPLSLGLLKVQP